MDRVTYSFNHYFLLLLDLIKPSIKDEVESNTIIVNKQSMFISGNIKKKWMTLLKALQE